MTAPLVEWSSDLDRDPKPGDVFAGRTTRTVGEVPAGSYLTLTVLQPGEPLAVGSIYVIEGGRAVAFCRVVEVLADGWLVERIDQPGSGELELPRALWQPRALIEVRPGRLN